MFITESIAVWKQPRILFDKRPFKLILKSIWSKDFRNCEILMITYRMGRHNSSYMLKQKQLITKKIVLFIYGFNSFAHTSDYIFKQTFKSSFFFLESNSRKKLSAVKAHHVDPVVILKCHSFSVQCPVHLQQKPSVLGQ